MSTFGADFTATFKDTVSYSVPIEVPDKTKPIKFIDYDGSLLYSYTVEEFNALKNLPQPVRHTGLVSNGWNYTLAEVKQQVLEVGNAIVGELYSTSDNRTRLYCHFEEGRLSPLFGIGLNGDARIDFGDGSLQVLLSSASGMTLRTISHNYSQPGDYVISIIPQDDSTVYQIYGISTVPYLLRKDSSTSSNISKVYSCALRKVELGTGVYLGVNAFANCSNLESITIPSGISNIDSYAFYNCYSLKGLVLPRTLSTIGNYTFYNCHELKLVSIPQNIRGIGSYAFYNCDSLEYVSFPINLVSIAVYAFQQCLALKELRIPSFVRTLETNAFYGCECIRKLIINDGLTTINSQVFYALYSIAKVEIPSSVSSIGVQAFGSGYGVSEYHMKKETPPSLSNSNVFASIPSDCLIYVPYSVDHSILNTYKTAQYWSTYANQIVEEPE